MNARSMLAGLLLAVFGHGFVGVHAAEMLYSENFDGPDVKPSQSILKAPLGWKLISPNDPSKDRVGNIFLGAGKYGWAGNYLEGGTATVPDAENYVHRVFPAVLGGKVVLSCRAFATGETSAGSSIGLCPPQPRFYSRGGGWMSTADGWKFWVGRVHSDAYPILDGRKFGPYTVLQESLRGAHDVTVELSMTVDLDDNKAWGEARWKDAQGRTETFKTQCYDWDTAAGTIACVALDIDTRDGHTGIALDDIRVVGDLPTTKPHPFDQRQYTVQQLQGDDESISHPAEIQWISKPWNGENAQMPYLVYMPEKDRVLMLASCRRRPCRAALTASDDHGQTWGPRRWLSVDDSGQPNANALGLTYLGDGRLLAFPEDIKPLWSSSDFGQTWAISQSDVPGGGMYAWDPLMVIHGPDGRVERLVQACWHPTGAPRHSTVDKYSQAYLRFSLDKGRSWSEPTKIPQWLGVNEVTILVAKNGDWVAACRLDNAPWNRHRDIPDLYSGLGVSISKDQGKTWSDMKVLYEFGRHHPSMVLLPDGRILMTYVVRLGYPNTADEFPEVGVEAVISDDNGQTWDMAHRYVLAKWEGNLRGEDSWFCSVQSTSTVLLPDGTILTAFGTGFTNALDAPWANMDDPCWCKMDVAVVRWRLDSQAPDEK